MHFSEYTLSFAYSMFFALETSNLLNPLGPCKSLIGTYGVAVFHTAAAAAAINCSMVIEK